jgi:hypothetical protein
LSRIEEYLSIDPDSILPHHCHLFGTDFEALGCGPTSHRLLWLADTDSALAATRLATFGGFTDEAHEYFSKRQCGCFKARSSSPVSD